MGGRRGWGGPTQESGRWEGIGGRTHLGGWEAGGGGGRIHSGRRVEGKRGGGPRSTDRQEKDGYDGTFLITT